MKAFLLFSLLFAAVAVNCGNGYILDEHLFVKGDILNDLYKQLSNQTQLNQWLPYVSFEVNFPNGDSIRGHNFTLDFGAHLKFYTSGFEWIKNAPDAEPFAPERMQISIDLAAAHRWIVQIDVTNLNSSAKCNAVAELRSPTLHLVVQYATDAEFRNSHNPPLKIVNSSLTAKAGQINFSNDLVFNSTQEKLLFTSAIKWDLEGDFLKNFQLERGVEEKMHNFFKSRYYTVTQYFSEKFIGKLSQKKELNPLVLPSVYQVALNGSAELGHFVLHRSNFTYQALSYRSGISFLNESQIVCRNWLPDAEWLLTSLDVQSNVHPEWNVKDVELWSKLSGELQLQVNLDHKELHVIDFSVVDDQIFLEYYFNQEKVHPKVADAIKNLILPTVGQPKGAFALLKADLLARFKQIATQQVQDDLKDL